MKLFLLVILATCTSRTEKVQDLLLRFCNPMSKVLNSMLKIAQTFTQVAKYFLVYQRKHFSDTGCYIAVQ